MKKCVNASTGPAIILLLLFFTACKQPGKRKIDSAFSAYISAFTSGTISRESAIRVRLSTETAKDNEVDATIEKKIFEFDPAIKGKTVWIDKSTVEFRPSENMKPGQVYEVTFHLSQVTKVPEKFSDFEFDFQVIPQSFEVNVDGMKPLNNKNFSRQILSGTLNTADVEDADNVETVLKATQNKRALPIRWMHQADRKVHAFEVDSIIRGEDSSAVLLVWNGKGMDVDLAGEKNVVVPAFGDFILMDAQVTQDGTQQYALLRFSDPLLENQNLQGLITLGDKSDMRLVIADNTIRIYPASRQSNNQVLWVAAGVKNVLGKSMKYDSRWTIQFEEIKPAVRLVGNGVILPGTGGLVFPFEAVNLNTVDVTITKIFENNVAQFLQVNNLDGTREMVRVGKRVLKKSVPLATLKQTDFTRWNRYALDLSDLVQTEPGAVYRIMLSFKKKYSLYYCAEEDSTVKEENMETVDEDEPRETSYWDYEEEYYYYGEDYWPGYQWQNRENPCKREYYTSQHWVSRNVIASDLGLIAKRGAEGSMFFAVTDLKTTQAVSGVSLEIYNYQKQLIQKTETNSSGEARINLTQKPFLLVAKKGTQRGYLKLDDGSSLSLSMFDVSGERVQKGVKGFIYGERGVWRPGDSLFVTFVLEDKQKTLPPVHPVTFELYNPHGQIVKKMVRNESMNGFYSFITSTDADAPTGNWEAKVKVGSVVFSKNIRIETIMPNRLKIKLDFPKPYLTNDEQQPAKLEVKWLHGAVARNLKSDVKVTLTPNRTSFPKYSDYVFDDPTRPFSSEPQTIFEGKVNENGIANFNADIEVDNVAPGVLTANFVIKAFEPGGNFSTDRFSVPFHAYDDYVGIRVPQGDKARGMLLTDTNHLVQVVTVDKTGAPLAAKRNIEIEVYQVQWRWWWDRSEEYLTNFASSQYARFVTRDTITVMNGKASWTFRLNYPDWGRFLVRARNLESGHCTGKTIYVDWPGWAGRQRNAGSNATMLTFTSDKEKYNVGEEAMLTVPTAKNSRALISIESGTKVLANYWMEGGEGETQFKFPVTAQMTPNIYVHITQLQQHSQTSNDLPIRMYGVIPVSVENPNTHLTPVIKMPEVLHPEEQVKISVSESKGKSMTYTVAVVDEGLLDITRFKTPDPWNHFYAREALGVKTWDMFDMVMGAWGAQIERILSMGGDEGISKPKDGTKANRFKPVVKFMGPFTLKPGETQTHSFIMPQYVGSVRTMVIAGENGAYGFAEKATPVRKPVMVLATLPRVLGPDENVAMPITVFAMEKNVKEVKVEIFPNDMLEVQGEKSSIVKFAQPGDDVVTFNLKVKPRLGIGRVKVIATSGTEKAETSIELDVRNPNMKIVEVIDTVLEAGQMWNHAYKPVGMTGTNKAIIELSTMPPINLGQRLDYLIRYPHGCIEQTTSSVFPQLYLAELLDLPAGRKAVIESNIKAGIERIKLFMMSGGGISYWPGEPWVNDWASNYAGHFMVEAELKGYTMPPGFMEQWKRHQRNMATSWTVPTATFQYTYRRESYELTQAYRLYTLALAKAPELGSMNRLREMKNLSVTASWCLAAAYQLAGQTEVANQLIENLPTTVKEYLELTDSYGSDERDEAMILETLTLMGKRDKATTLMRKLSVALSDGHRWMSTQTTAYSLLAIAKYMGRSAKSEMNASYRFGPNAIQSVNTKQPIKQAEIKIQGEEGGTFTVNNNGKGLLFARVLLEGIPRTGDKVSTQNDLSMKLVYKGMDGTEINPTKMKQGTDFYVDVSITNPGQRGHYAEMALSQIFPSGWEIHNTRLDNVQTTSTEIDVPRYQDIRDDRVYSYFNLKANETKTFRVYLNASYLGTFYLPAAYSEAMYDASINSRQAGRWVTVESDKGDLSLK